MLDKTVVEKIILEYIGKTDLFLVDINISRVNIIQVLVDKPSGISITECADLNRYILEKLSKDEEDYELEVSSPGTSSPLKVLPQYLKNIGRNVEIIKKNGEKIKGKLLNAASDMIKIEVGKKIRKEGKKKPEIIFEPVTISTEEIKSTKVLVSLK